MQEFGRVKFGATVAVCDAGNTDAIEGAPLEAQPASVNAAADPLLLSMKSPEQRAPAISSLAPPRSDSVPIV